MPHTYINGFGGSALFASATLDVENWTLSASGEALDTTNSGDAGWESNILGAKAWEGSCKAYWDNAASPTGAAGLLPGSRGTLALSVGGTGKSYGGTVQITQITTENPVKGVVTFSLTFKGSGALTYAS